MLTKEHKEPPAETWLRARYGAYRGHFAWRELEEAYAAGAKDMQERCAKLVDTHEWVGDAVYDIKALETT